MDELRAAIRASLEKFWDEHSLNVTAIDSIENLIDELDSLSAVDALLDIEALVGKHIPEGSVIRPGGYNSKNQFVDDLTQRVLDYVGKEK